MAKKKMKMDTAAMKEFLLQHVEKFVLGAVLVLVIVFVYLGSTVETFPSNKSPSQLDGMVTSATTHMNANTWPKVEPTILPPSIEKPITITVKADEWGMPQIDPLIKPSRSKRSDPILYPPTKLEGVGMPLAVVTIPGEEEISPLDQKWQEMQDELQAPLAPLPVEDNKKKGRQPARPPVGGLEGVQIGRGVGAPGGVNMPRMVSEEDRAEMQGYRPSGQSIAKTRYAIILKALVPYQKQLEQFREALPNNVYFNEERDSPSYIFFYVERADVTDNPDADPKDLKWIPLSTRTAQRLPYEKDAPWEAIPEELIDPAYVLPGITLPVPPALMTDMKKLAGHPDIPWAATGTELLGKNNDTAVEEPGAAEPEGPELPSTLDVNGAGERGGPGFNPSRGAPSGREGGGRGYPSRGGPGYGREGGGGGAFGDLAATYKLFRFVDFEVEQGHKYRYRVKLTLEDPNHPAIPAMATTDPSPLPQSLDKDVEARLRELAKEEERTGKRKFYRDTDWSEVSPVLSVAESLKLAGGEVSPARFATVNGGKVQTAEPSGKLMVVQWDDQYATNVAGEEQVELGSVLNFKKDVEAVHPIKLEYVKLKDYHFDSEAIVVDFRGGDKLPGGYSGNALYAPGSIAVIDEHGNLKVQSEVSDSALWQRYHYYEPKKLDPQPGLEGVPEPGRAGGGLEDVYRPRTRRPAGGR